jgi:hypothetical protein
MMQVVSHRAFTAETPVRSRAWAHEICGGQINIRSDFSLITSVSFHLILTFFFILICTLSGRQAGEEWKPSNKLTLFRISRYLRQKTEEKAIGNGFWRGCHSLTPDTELEVSSKEIRGFKEEEDEDEEEEKEEEE